MRRLAVVSRSTPPTTLDSIARDPAMAAGLPLAMTTALLAQVAVVQSALATRALALALEPSATVSGAPLTVRDAAAALNVSVDWLYRHAHELPFTVRHGRALRFTTDGIAAYLRDRAGQR